MSRCSLCTSEACYVQRYSGLRLCREHFLQQFERRVRRTLLRGRMLRRNSKVAVALSGGKDSTVLLHLLHGYAERLNIELVGILIDEGIAGYREVGRRRALRHCSELDVELVVRSFRESFGFTLDEAAHATHWKPCTVCSVLRRYLLNRAARELGCDALATGHNLDDTAQAVLMNYLRGDVERLLRGMRSERMVPRIKPLVEVPEKEVAVYALLSGLEVGFEECSYAAESFRSEVREVILRLEEHTPGIRYGILRGWERLRRLTRAEHRGLRSCERCGEPCSSRVCAACRVVEAVRLGMQGG